MASGLDNMPLILRISAEPLKKRFRRGLETEIRIVATAEMQHRRRYARQEINNINIRMIRCIDAGLIQHCGIETVFDSQHDRPIRPPQLVPAYARLSDSISDRVCR